MGRDGRDSEEIPARRGRSCVQGIGVQEGANVGHGRAIEGLGLRERSKYIRVGVLFGTGGPAVSLKIGNDRG
jgi:hypothetical protein